MVPANPNPASRPLDFSIIIAVYNDWELLTDCLKALSEQTNSPRFEVIIADDGSHSPAPESIQHWSKSLPLTIVREAHAGIAAARNRGIQSSSGDLLVFTDADCRFREDSLSALAAEVANRPQHNCFQLHLHGDGPSLAGRAEELRLIEIQKQMKQADGRIRYLNTAGFAIRRSGVDVDAGLFDRRVLRAEDTLLLADLIQRGELPWFVADAVVYHSISMSLPKCFQKDLRAAWLEATAFEKINMRGVQIRMSHRERFAMLLSMWKTAGQSSIGHAAWFVLVARQSLQRIVTAAHRFFASRESVQHSENAP